MKDVFAIFERVGKRLKSEPWFKKGKWLISVHPFPAKNPDGITFRIYKKHWFNDDHNGIHVESFLHLDQKKRRNTYITLHLLHQNVVPGTKLKRISLSQPIVDQISDEVRSWDGYKFRAGKYGQQPFAKNLDGSSEAFERDLFGEASRICKKLGPVVDQCLRSVLGNSKIASSARKK